MRITDSRPPQQRPEQVSITVQQNVYSGGCAASPSAGHRAFGFWTGFERRHLQGGDVRVTWLRLKYMSYKENKRLGVGRLPNHRVIISYFTSFRVHSNLSWRRLWLVSVWNNQNWVVYLASWRGPNTCRRIKNGKIDTWSLECLALHYLQMHHSNLLWSVLLNKK